MGNSSHPKLPGLPGLPPAQESHPLYGSYTSIQNQQTHEQYDAYLVQLSSRKEIEQYYNCFLQRYREQYIVSTVDFVDLSYRQFCGEFYRVQLYVEHIPVRFSHFTDLPYPDNIYVIRNALLGFQILYHMAGYFQVLEDHICVNAYGEVKVWLNTDLSKNFPLSPNEQIKSECDMVSAIIKMVEQNSNTEGLIPIEFSEYLVKKNKKFPNFEECLHMLNSYIEQFQSKVPNYCQSILDLFNQQDDHQSCHIIENINNDQQKRQSQGSIVINDITVPRLDMTNVGANRNHNRNQYNRLSNQSTENRKMQLVSTKPFDQLELEGKWKVENQGVGEDQELRKLRETLRISEKGENGGKYPNTLYLNVSSRIPTQQTQRVERRKSTSQAQQTKQNYNRLSTKRTPAPQTNSGTQRVFVRPEVRKNSLPRPNISFTYLPAGYHVGRFPGILTNKISSRQPSLLFNQQYQQQSILHYMPSRIQSCNERELNIQTIQPRRSQSKLASKLKSQSVEVGPRSHQRCRQNTALSNRIMIKIQDNLHTANLQKQTTNPVSIPITNKYQKQLQRLLQPDQVKQYKDQQISIHNQHTDQRAEVQIERESEIEKQIEKQNQVEIERERERERERKYSTASEDGKKVRKPGEFRCFYDTQYGSQEIDPVIAVDLLQYL